MSVMSLRRWLIPTVLLAGMNASGAARCETFFFGGNQNGFNGQPSALLTLGQLQLQLAAGTSGARLNEPQAAGMGIDSTSLAPSGAVDSAPALFNTIGGSGPIAGDAESVVFTFNRAGILTGMNFDGVKDESLEYFILESAGGLRVNFFDSAANTTIAGAVSSATMVGAVTGAVVYLLEIDSNIDDEAQGLSIPFSAGQQFTLSFHSLGAQFGPTDVANGARWQAITVEAVPEPPACSLVFVAVWALFVGRRSSREFVFALKRS